MKPITALQSGILRRLIPCFIIITFLFIAAKAQSSKSKKLPRIQLKPIKAPEKVIIDGKIEDWSVGFSAFNSNTNTFYTIANDASNLYLIIKSGNYEAMQKMILGGVSLMIKHEKSEFKVFYPAYNKSNPNWIANWGSSISINSPLYNNKIADSIMKERNQTLAKRIKMIGVKEFGNETDTLHSVYNAKGIVARSRFDLEGNYIAEWSIPLSFLMSSDKTIKAFEYKIELPGRTANSLRVNVDTERQRIFVDVPGGEGYVIPLNPGNLAISLPTYFKGKYVLGNLSEP
jgi:hypothetical protein